MSWRPILIVLGLLWAGALAWLFSTWGPDYSASGEDPIQAEDIAQAEDSSVGLGSGADSKPSTGPLPQASATEGGSALDLEGESESPEEFAQDPAGQANLEPAVAPGAGDSPEQAAEPEQPSQPLEPTPSQRRVFEKIFKPIEKASERYERHEELDKSSWFGEDRKSNGKAIDLSLIHI